MAEDTVRQECDERTGEYRENEAGEDRDPLQETAARQSGFGTKQSKSPIENSEFLQIFSDFLTSSALI